ncbi:MAG: metallophosphoesterase, partial [Synergistetes bacterium]|nr:metallophosphoesterase [Synergistota bacterium]
MKVVITADWHIDGYGERYEVAKWILRRAEAENAVLIVAGDILDRGVRSHTLLDELFSGFDVPVYVIRGNHDIKLSSEYVGSSNVCLIDEAEVKVVGGVPFMFVPYPSDERGSLYGCIKMLHGEVAGKMWILVSHGDWVKGARGVYENAYFPLTADDIRIFSPSFVFLGHIHRRGCDKQYNVFYPGSPLPIAKDEYGLHYIIEFDLEDGKVDYIPVDVARIYLKEELCITPGDYRKVVDDWVRGVADRYGNYSVRSIEVSLDGITDASKKEISEYVHGAVSSLWEGVSVEIHNGVRVLKDFSDSVALKFVRDIKEMANKEGIDEQKVMEVVWKVVSNAVS